MAFMEYDEMYYIVYYEVGAIGNVCAQHDDLENSEITKKIQKNQISR